MKWDPLTSFEVLSLGIAFAGVAGVVLTLYYLVKQTKHLAESIAIASFQNISMSTLDIDRIFVEYPETRPYFYSRRPISEDAPNYNRVAAIAECFLDLFDTYLSQVKYNDEYSNVMKEYIIDMFMRSPILRTQLDDLSVWYPEALIAVKMEADKRLLSSARGAVHDGGVEDRLAPK